MLVLYVSTLYCLVQHDRLLELFLFFFFFFNDTATTEIYTLSLHDALPISPRTPPAPTGWAGGRGSGTSPGRDRKSTRLNSSHGYISYAVFCLKKKTPTPATRLRVITPLTTPRLVPYCAPMRDTLAPII